MKRGVRLSNAKSQTCASSSRSLTDLRRERYPDSMYVADSIEEASVRSKSAKAPRQYESKTLGSTGPAGITGRKSVDRAEGKSTELDGLQCSLAWRRRKIKRSRLRNEQSNPRTKQVEQDWPLRKWTQAILSMEHCWQVLYSG